MIDIGCGSGRWTDYFVDKAGFIEAIDPSDAVFVADKMLGTKNNVRITKASVDTIPWADETFDFGMSIGVLHHIPDTRQAMIDCVKKIKKGGYFYVYRSCLYIFNIFFPYIRKYSGVVEFKKVVYGNIGFLSSP